MDHILSLLSDTVPKARTLEELTRPLLSLLSRVTGMESTYLTTINTEEGIQRVEFARNAGTLVIPEGLVVPWADTLCKRALEENRMFTDNVAGCWGDSEAAAALGIKTYVSAPIRAQDGKVLGTICGASASQIAPSSDAEPLLNLLSGLLSYSLERDRLVEQLHSANTELTRLALTDSLTGLSNRRAILDNLARLLALAAREEKCVLVAVVDLDGFKQINDTFGHAAGDKLLCCVADQLRRDLRLSDTIGRTGGDEFVVVALGPSVIGADSAPAMQNAANLLQERLTMATIGTYDLGNDLRRFRYAGASVGVAVVIPSQVGVEEALMLADHEMYKTKQRRRSGRPEESRTTANLGL